MRPFSRQAAWLAQALLTVAVLYAGAVQAGELYIFGDSLSDSGNNAIATHGGDPTQAITGNAYVPTLPYATGTYSNGDVWASRAAAKLKAYEGAVPSLIGGDDFAFGGARAAANTDVPGALAQLQMYLGRGYAVHRDDVFVIAVGGNDLRDTLNAVFVDPGHAQTIIGNAAWNLATAVGTMVDTLQARGARHILVWNTPDLGLVPAVRAAGAQASGTATLIAGAFNSALAARLAGEDGVITFDVFGLLQHIVANKEQYGFVNVTDAAGAMSGIDPDSWLFWDGIHPTAAGHKVLARAVLQALPDLDDRHGENHGHHGDGRGNGHGRDGRTGDRR